MVQCAENILYLCRCFKVVIIGMKTQTSHQSLYRGGLNQVLSLDVGTPPPLSPHVGNHISPVLLLLNSPRPQNLDFMQTRFVHSPICKEAKKTEIAVLDFYKCLM